MRRRRKSPINVHIDASKDVYDCRKLTLQKMIGFVKNDEGLNPPSQWDLIADLRVLQEEAALQVAHCTKIFETMEDDDDNNNNNTTTTIAKTNGRRHHRL